MSDASLRAPSSARASTTTPLLHEQPDDAGHNGGDDPSGDDDQNRLAVPRRADRGAAVELVERVRARKEAERCRLAVADLVADSKELRIPGMLLQGGLQYLDRLPAIFDAGIQPHQVRPGQAFE